MSKTRHRIESISVRLALCWMVLSGTENSVDCVDDSVVDIKCSNLVDVTVEKSFDGSQDNESFECFKRPLEKLIFSLAKQVMTLDKLSFLNVDELKLSQVYVDHDIHIQANKDNVIINIIEASSASTTIFSQTYNLQKKP
ncbi:hypothetical protein SO802_028885 [Lithocarpus litseifolius]|uniref:Uncharacterized protein n=1 Tax=Lithocarpus litseifolius TaxID=425828 RepID=A0AAW2BTH6_9ROSI